MSSATSDHNVTETAFDAAKCKLSAASQGYFQDAFIHHFVPRPSRRIPLIHRGYYLRHIAISQSVELFLNEHAREGASARVQIVSLGAGFDTLFFRLLRQKQLWRDADLAFLEVDCHAIVDAKREIMTRDAATFAELFTPDAQQQHHHQEATDGSGGASIALQCRVDSLQASYSLVACDLGDVARLESLFSAAGLNRSLPTLVLAECVVSYLDPVRGSSLLQWLSTWFADAAAVIYDPLALTDPFGETLQRYFAAKGCELRALRAFQTAGDHYRRFLSAPSRWTTCRVLDMNAVFAGCTDAREKDRVSGLEVFDEFADWTLSNARYAVFLASNRGVGSPHWPAAFCPGLQVTPRMDAAAVALSPQAGGLAAVAVVRTFEPPDLAAVQQLFEATHLEYSAKAVRKFVAHRLRQGDMRDVHWSFMRPRDELGAARHVSCFWVAEVDGALVGCVGVKLMAAGGGGAAATAELCRLSVAPSARRRGVGSALVAVLEAFARTSGYTRVELETIGAMDSAQALYRARGYDEVARTDWGSYSLVRFGKEL